MCTPKSFPDPAPDWVTISKTPGELKAGIAQLRMACTDALEYINKGADHSGRWSIDYLKLRETLIVALTQTQSK